MIHDKYHLMLQLHRLEGFYWVARTGGYARAARAFPYPLTQPAVYQQVRKLEDELGLRLFDRVGQAEMRLTAPGRHLYQFAAPFFEQLPAVVRALRAADAPELRIAAEALVLHSLLPEWLGRLQRRLPDVRVSVQELPAADPEPVRAGDVDLAVAYFPGKLPPGLEVRRVASLAPYLVVPARHPLARRRTLHLRELAAETFITYPPGTVHHALQMKALARSRVTPARTIAATTADAIVGLVAAGIGCSLVPSLTTPRGGNERAWRKGVVAHRFGAGAIEFAVSAICRRTTLSNPALDAALATAPPG